MPEPISPLEKLTADAQQLGNALADTFTTWKGNFVRNTHASFAGMTAKGWIRLTVIVCAYLLVRPYLVNYATKLQEKNLQKALMDEEDRKQREKTGTKLTANDLRGGRAKVDVPGEESESEGEEGQATGKEAKQSQWGRKARVRQRKMVKRAMEIHESNLADKGNESDKDIEDLLED